MRNKIAELVLSLLGVVTLLFVVSPSAHAGECHAPTVCGSLYHYNGSWDKPVGVRCQFGLESSKRYVAVGHSDPCKDMDQVYVYKGAELWCRIYYKDGPYYYKEFDSTGWHKTNDLWQKACTYRHD